MKSLNHRSHATAATGRIAELEQTVRAMARTIEATGLERDRYRAALLMTRGRVHLASEENWSSRELDTLWRDVELLTRAGRGGVVADVAELAGARL